MHLNWCHYAEKHLMEIRFCFIFMCLVVLKCYAGWLLSDIRVYIMFLHVFRYCFMFQKYFFMLVMWDTCGQRDFHNVYHLKKNSGDSRCISYQTYNLSVLVQHRHQSITTSVSGSASCPAGSCIWTWVSNNLNPLSTALSMLRPKPAAWPKVTAAPLHLPSSPVPEPLCPGKYGGGRTFQSGQDAREQLQGCWKGM